MIDPRRVNVLRLLDQEGTVTATAAALHLTPSAVSQQIRQLAQDTGADLLVPDGRRVRLSPAAHALIAYANRAAEAWEHTRTRLDAEVEDAPRELRIAGFATSFGALLAPAAARLRRAHPHVTVRLAEDSTDPSLTALLAGTVDLAVIPAQEGPALDDPRFERHPLLDDPQDLVVPAGHRLAGRRSVPLAEAAGENWIAPHHDQHQLILVACAAAGFTPRTRHHAADWNAVLAMVAHGFGVCLLPRLVLPPTSADVVRVPLAGSPRPARKVLTVVRKGAAGQPAITWALAALKGVSAERDRSA